MENMKRADVKKINFEHTIVKFWIIVKREYIDGGIFTANHVTLYHIVLIFSFWLLIGSFFYVILENMFFSPRLICQGYFFPGIIFFKHLLHRTYIIIIINRLEFYLCFVVVCLIINGYLIIRFNNFFYRDLI